MSHIWLEFVAIPFSRLINYRAKATEFLQRSRLAFGHKLLANIQSG
jgi:hypothetical protein